VENEIIEMRIATWNVGKLYRPGAMNELVKEMDKYEVDICALQDTGWPQKRTMIK
jgi:exonuclease III